jgi:transcription elongation factor GreB
MSKAFTRENDSDIEDDVEDASPLPEGSRNYMTAGGFARLKAELSALCGK